MKTSLQLKMGQQLTMTPQLQQAIRLLQLSTLDLQQEIQQALDSNPMLETDEFDDGDGHDSQDNDHSDRDDDQHIDNGDKAEAPEPDYDPSPDQDDVDASWEDNKMPDDLPVDSQWEDTYQISAGTGSASAAPTGRASCSILSCRIARSAKRDSKRSICLFRASCSARETGAS